MRYLFIIIFISGFWAQASCEQEYTVKKQFQSPLKSIEQIHADNNWGILYRAKPKQEEYLSWGKSIYEKSPKYKKEFQVEEDGLFEAYEVVPENSYFVELGKKAFDRKLETIQKQRQQYLSDMALELENNKQYFIQQAVDETAQYLKDLVGYNMANIIDNAPAEIQESYQGLTLALQKFYSGMGKHQPVAKKNLKFNEMTGASQKQEALPEIAKTPEFLEVEKAWSEIGAKAYKAQERVFEPTFEFLNTLKQHIELTKPAADDPIVALNQKIISSLKNDLGIEVMPYEPGTPFNVDFHEALSVLPAPEFGHNEIITVAELGFTRIGRELPLKYAKVVVSKNQ